LKTTIIGYAKEKKEMQASQRHRAELDRLIELKGQINQLLVLMELDLVIRRRLEQLDSIRYKQKPALVIEQRRARWQKSLAEVDEDIGGTIDVLIRHQSYK
jgi:hypothetical protein